MINKELLILEKAIEKALNNKWNNYVLDKEEAKIDSQFIAGSSDNYYDIIFSHDFAKAFWGEESLKCGKYITYHHAWKYHLQKMVLETEPIKYLEKFL